jgi:nucleoside-diphosphate-sugar epimerase
VGAIIHAAAVARFNVEAGAAHAVNVAGTQKLLAFARGCPQLGAFSYVSTLYASGLRAGDIAEAPLSDGAGFANHYESSKWAAERLVLAAGLPGRILRLPTLIADDENGGISQRNAFHNTLGLLRAGLLALVPGRAETPLYFASGRWAARAIVDLTLQEAAGVYHLCHGPAAALGLGRLLEVAHQRFARDPAFRARRLLPPPLCDRQTFDEVANAVSAVSGPLLAQALASITPFAPQLFVQKSIDNQRLRAALPGHAPPAALPLVQAALDSMMTGAQR